MRRWGLLGILLIAGCGLEPFGHAPAEEAPIELLSPEDREILQALNQLGGLSIGEEPQAVPAAEPRRYTTQSLVSAIQAQVESGYYVGPYPNARGMEAGYRERAFGENPLVSRSGSQTTTETYWTPDGVASSTEVAYTKRVEANGETTLDLYAAPRVKAADLPDFFKSKLTLEPGYTVDQAEETYASYRAGAIKGTAVGYRWAVLSPGGSTLAWIRAFRVTRPDGTKVHSYRLLSDYRPVAGVVKPTRHVYCDYFEASGVGNEMDQRYEVATGTWKGEGAYRDTRYPARGMTVSETLRADGTASRVLTQSVAIGGLTTTENYQADGSGSGSVSLNGTVKASLSWTKVQNGTVSLGSGTQPYFPTRSYGVRAVVSTYAGSGQIGALDGRALSASFRSPEDLELDASGAVMVADTSNRYLRRITPTGEVSRLGGDQGYLVGLGRDRSGRFWLANKSSLLRFDAASLKVEHMFGLGPLMPPSDGSEIADAAAGQDGTVYFLDSAHSTLRAWEGPGQARIIAGGLNSPQGLAVDRDGSLIVADTGSHRLLRISPEGETSLLAGSGQPGFLDGMADSAQFNRPNGVAVDTEGNVYVADEINNRIRKISQGQVSTVAGDKFGGAKDGVGSLARFMTPRGVAVDGLGNVYVADTGNNRIRKITFR